MNDDTISRAAAVKALEETKQSDPFNRYEYQNIGIDWSIDAIKALPSAQLAQDLTNGCTDTISRAAIVDAIEGVDWYHMTDSGEMVHGANSAEDQPWYKAEDIYAAIEALPPAQPGWIPTSERLPDNDRAVLVTLKWAEDDYEVAVGEYWHNSTASHGWGSFEGHVIAWHELPTPYREGGQDGKN